MPERILGSRRERQDPLKMCRVLGSACCGRFGGLGRRMRIPGWQVQEMMRIKGHMNVLNLKCSFFGFEGVSGVKIVRSHPN